MRKLSFLIATTIAAVLLASACGGDGEPAATATPSAAPTATPTPGAPATPADTGEGLLFQPHQRFPLGDPAMSLAVADLNGDGVPDVVAALLFSQDVSVLLGNGDGSFQPQQRFAVGDGPTSVAVADLDGDGAPDIVTAIGASGDVSVLLGNGDGSFPPEERFAAGDSSLSPPVAVAVADLNGDGAPDIVTANLLDVAVLPGNSDGSFQPQQRFPVGDSDFTSSSMAVADLDGDGTPDLVTVGAPDDASVLLGNSDGSFQPQQRFAVGDGSFSSNSVAVADLDGDGTPDLVIANGADISVLLHR